MIKFEDIYEATIREATIDNFMSKINSCQTLEGLEELEKYYDKRSKETTLADSDDIIVRDALAGRRQALEADSEDEDDEDF
uniref:ATP-dependent DNA helicase uvsW n=1 Tax=Klebsiella phage Phi_KR1 TaxID=3240396 RepID=A0AB39U0G1_9CAUD